MIANGRGTARCVTRTSSVEIMTFDVVGEDFGAAEGVGDASLAYR